MAFNGVATNGNTYCRSGQDVMRNAIPVCAADQIVSFNGSAFYCKNSEIELPTCPPGASLTSDGASISCAQQLTLPTCAADQVLTVSNGTLTCIAGGSGAPCTLLRDTKTYTSGESGGAGSVYIREFMSTTFPTISTRGGGVEQPNVMTFPSFPHGSLWIAQGLYSSTPPIPYRNVPPGTGANMIYQCVNGAWVYQGGQATQPDLGVGF